ncbi:hypothetical protein G4307_00035 [Dorea longicatena]|uniref:hypothetical protein n=1 Tax=Dorea longicatena TaxID=88431 RepID=UPI0015701FBF|nr:hypothetical protein [Dorea longicatena]NSE34642.1 hypothetical protein [Dorea longicatena]
MKGWWCPPFRGVILAFLKNAERFQKFFVKIFEQTKYACLQGADRRKGNIKSI